MEVGAVIDGNYILTAYPIMRVDGIYPIRYNGDDGNYVVCVPEDATHVLIKCVDTEGCEGHLILVKDFEGKDTLIDLF